MRYLIEATNGTSTAVPPRWALPKVKQEKWRPDCPRCESKNVHRSRRRWLERLIGKWLHAYQCMYRCHQCGFRFWGSLDRQDRQTMKMKKKEE